MESDPTADEVDCDAGRAVGFAGIGLARTLLEATGAAEFSPCGASVP